MADTTLFIYSLIAVTAAFFLILKVAKARQPDVGGLSSPTTFSIYGLSWIIFQQSDHPDNYPRTLVHSVTFVMLEKLSKKAARRCAFPFSPEQYFLHITHRTTREESSNSLKWTALQWWFRARTTSRTS